jgi:hypothetical protein
LGYIEWLRHANDDQSYAMCFNILRTSNENATLELVKNPTDINFSAATHIAQYT